MSGNGEKVGMVERVARAIAKRQGDDFDAIAKDKPDWINNRGIFNKQHRDINAPFQVEYIDMAEAAIEAMRKPPTELFNQFGSGEASKWAPGIWECMLAAALSEEG